MANTISLSQAVSTDHSTVTITDSTTYSSPLRTVVGVYLNVYKVDFQGGETLVATTLNNSDPNSTSTWTFDLDYDGHYRYKYVAPPDYNVGTTYAIYDAVFDPTNQLVYRSKSNGNIGNSLLNTTFWEPITDPATLADNDGTATESLNTDTSIVNRVIGTLTADKRDSHAVEASLECCLDCERNKDVDLFTLLDLFAAALVEADSSSEFNKGERIARRADAL